MTETPLLGLALLMGVVTYGTRVAAFLLPLDRLPAGLLGAMRLMGPASMATVAAVALFLPSTEPGTPGVPVGVTWLASGLCIALVARTRSLALGVVGALAVAILVA